MVLEVALRPVELTNISRNWSPSPRALGTRSQPAGTSVCACTAGASSSGGGRLLSLQEPCHDDPPVSCEVSGPGGRPGPGRTATVRMPDGGLTPQSTGNAPAPPRSWHTLRKVLIPDGRAGVTANIGRMAKKAGAGRHRTPPPVARRALALTKHARALHPQRDRGAVAQFYSHRRKTASEQ